MTKEKTTMLKDGNDRPNVTAIKIRKRVKGDPITLGYNIFFFTGDQAFADYKNTLHGMFVIMDGANFSVDTENDIYPYLAPEQSITPTENGHGFVLKYDKKGDNNSNAYEFIKNFYDTLEQENDSIVSIYIHYKDDNEAQVFKNITADHELFEVPDN